MSQLIIFDWDWTLARGENTTQEKPFRKKGERYVWMEDEDGNSRGEAVEWLYKEDGYYVAIASNQDGISYGFQDYEETESAIWEVLKQFDWPIPFLICPYHPDGKDANLYQAWEHWRKPNGEMMLVLWHLFPDVKREQVMVVGDREEDKQAAEAAGFTFEWADAFFNGVDQAMMHDAIREHVMGEQFDDMPLAPGRVYEDDEPPFSFLL
jgi:HAD superfamily hydrolase (TIGR01662 family)